VSRDTDLTLVGHHRLAVLWTSRFLAPGEWSSLSHTSKACGL